jgi:hypothetical protein
VSPFHTGPFGHMHKIMYPHFIVRIAAGFMFSLVRNLMIMHCATAKGTTSSLILITTDRKQVVCLFGYLMCYFSDDCFFS